MSKKTGILRPLGMALVLAIGFGSVFAIIAAWAFAVWESLATKNSMPYENLVVRTDGTPLIQRYNYDGYSQNVTFHTLDGSEVPSDKVGGTLLTGADLAIPRWDSFFPLFNDRVRVSRFADGRKPTNLWYFMDDGARDGRGYFVGYDSESKLRVGFIGRDGFRPDEPPAEQWFPMDGVKLLNGRAFSRYAGNAYAYYSFDDGAVGEEFTLWKVDMISGGQLLEVDLRAGSVATLMESADLIAVRGLQTVSTSKAAGEEPPRALHHRHLAVRTSDRVLVFDAAGKKPSAYLLPEGLRDRTITFYELDSERAFVTSSRVLPDQSQREELKWIDASGKVLREAEVSLNGRSRGTDANAAWMIALAAPVPALLTVVATVFVPLSDMDSGLAPNYAAALAHSLAIFWPGILVVLLLSAALAVYCYRRHCRYDQPFSVVWLVFVFLAGLPGLVAYLFHRRWPVLEKCPACGREVPRDREACAACSKAFPAPEPKGYEVFA